MIGNAFDNTPILNLIGSDFKYNGPVKLSPLSEKRLSEFELFDGLYADKDGNLVSQRFSDEKENTPIAFYFGDNLFASIRLMDPLSPDSGSFKFKKPYTEGAIAYYGFPDIILSKKMKKEEPYNANVYQKGLEILSKGHAEVNWNKGPLTLASDNTYNDCGIWSTLFNCCFRFRTKGTKRGDWFIPTVENAINIAKAVYEAGNKINDFPEDIADYLKKLYDMTQYRFSERFFMTSEDKTQKKSLNVRICNGNVSSLHKLGKDGEIQYPIACIELTE